MLEPILLSLFAMALLGCVVFDISVVGALLFGYLLFFGYGLFRHCTVRNLVQQSLKGIGTVQNILISMLLIGSITALWRASGTIAMIVQYTTQFLAPAFVLCLVFLLCCLLSCLTGTAFGTAATMGVISMTIATSMGVPAVLSGGAVLAGSYFGDRCSPMSTSALLTSTLTDIAPFENLRGMLGSTAVPFGITCALYLVLGWWFQPQADTLVTVFDFGAHFNLHPLVLLPAVLIIVLSLLQLPIKRIMCMSIVLAIAITVGIQQVSLTDTLRIAIYGFAPADATLSALLGGGGVVSMLSVVAVVGISSCYAGLFAESRFLDNFVQHIHYLATRCNAYVAVLVTSVLVSMVACNQTLAIMLTHQLCRDVEPDRHRMAQYLSNSAVVIAPLVPWSIAGAVPLSSVGAPLSSMVAACFLYVLPIYSLYYFHKSTK